MKPKTKESEKQSEKHTKHGVKGVLLSILFFILMAVFTIGLIASMTLHLMLQNHTLQKTVQNVELADITVSDGTQLLSLSDCMHEYYMTNNPASKEDMATILNSSDTEEYVLNVLDNYSAYLLGRTNELEKMDVADFCDLIESGLRKEVSNQAAIEYDVSDWDRMNFELGEQVNQMDRYISSGFTGFLLQTTASWLGTIVFGVLMVLTFVLWLVLGIRGHWGVGKVLRNYGWSSIIWGLLGLIGSLVVYALIQFTSLLSNLQFLQGAGFQWEIPFAEAAGAAAIYGVIFLIVGIPMNQSVKRRSKKPEQIVPIAATVPEQQPVLAGVTADASAASATEAPASLDTFMQTQPAEATDSFAPEAKSEQVSEPADSEGTTESEQTTAPVTESEPVTAPAVEPEPAAAPVVESASTAAPAVEPNQTPSEPKEPTATESVICLYCGFRNEPDSKFCGGCGKPLHAK